MSNNKVALVTGSSRGIGAGLVKYLAQKGYKVVINYATSAAEAQQVQAEIAAQVGADAILAIQADVSNRAAVQAMFDAIRARLGQVDVLINNAGLNLDGPFLHMTDAQWQRVIDVSLTGTFICSQEFARRFTGEGGQIINMAASTGLRGRKNGANYCSAKAGVITLTKCLALELAPHIRVNCILPGYIDTEEVLARYNLHDAESCRKLMETIPFGRLGTAEDICKLVYFLITAADYMTGQNFFVNGGNFMY